MKRKQKIKNPYHLNFRKKDKNGVWGSWVFGIGEWESLELAQKQIKNIRQSCFAPLEVQFIKDGMLLDYNGNEIGKSIIYETK